MDQHDCVRVKIFVDSQTCIGKHQDRAEVCLSVLRTLLIPYKLVASRPCLLESLYGADLFKNGIEFNGDDVVAKSMIDTMRERDILVVKEPEKVVRVKVISCLRLQHTSLLADQEELIDDLKEIHDTLFSIIGECDECKDD